MSGFFFVIMLLIAFGAIAVLIQRGSAKAGVVVIILILPFLYLFGLPLFESSRFPSETGGIMNALIIGIVASVIAGIILMFIKK